MLHSSNVPFGEMHSLGLSGSSFLFDLLVAFDFETFLILFILNISHLALLAAATTRAGLGAAFRCVRSFSSIGSWTTRRNDLPTFKLVSDFLENVFEPS
jgi:hypothetical protein